MFNSDDPFIQDLYDKYLVSKGVSTDTRTLKPNEIFFALKGDNFDGNAYAMQALEKGASFAVVDSPELRMNDDPRLIRTPNALFTLQHLAHHHCLKKEFYVTAITGSNGKTTTKEIFRHIVRNEDFVAVTEGNLNNHIGVPLTILKKYPPSVTELVLEFGDNHLGDIDLLCRIAEPMTGLITNIGEDHLGEFGGMNNNINSKLQLFDYIIKHNEEFGLLFINLYDKILESYAEQLEPIVRVVLYGNGESLEGEIVMANVSDTPKGLSMKIIVEGYGEESVKSQLRGAYNAQNILAAYALAMQFVGQETIIEGISSYVPQNNRSQWIDKGTYQILLDAYNANPSSMREAIKSVCSWKKQQPVLFLGDMLELGDYSAEYHRKMLAFIEMYKPVEVVTVGSEFAKAVKGNTYSYPIRAVEQVADLKDEWKTIAESGTVVLIKGSRGIGMEKILEYL
jgi:UDP-N-acetylmuramoyl-tripeptide--D-alanyl-D-alanine ligase